MKKQTWEPPERPEWMSPELYHYLVALVDQRVSEYEAAQREHSGAMGDEATEEQDKKQG